MHSSRAISLAMRHPKNGLTAHETKDSWFSKKKHYVACEALDWLVARLQMKREQAISVMQQMLDERMIIFQSLKASSNPNPSFHDDGSQFVFAKEMDDDDSVPKPKVPKKGTKDSVALLDIAPVEISRQVLKKNAKSTSLITFRWPWLSIECAERCHLAMLYCYPNSPLLVQ